MKKITPQGVMRAEIEVVTRLMTLTTTIVEPSDVIHLNSNEIDPVIETSFQSIVRDRWQTDLEERLNTLSGRVIAIIAED